MKESYEECEASNFGLQRRCDCGNNVVLSVRAGGACRPAIELPAFNTENRQPLRVPTLFGQGEGNIESTVMARSDRTRRSQGTRACVQHLKRENREVLLAPRHLTGVDEGGQRTSPSARLT
jgi:hypothetical protein